MSRPYFLFDLHKHPTDVTWEKSLVGNIFRRGEEGGLDGAPLDGGPQDAQMRNSSRNFS